MATTGFLLSEVDGSEEKPIGVYATPGDAARAYHEQQEAYVDGSPADDAEFVEQSAEFWSNYEENVPSTLPRFPHRLDAQFESGFGSVDVRIVAVEVNL